MIREKKIIVRCTYELGLAVFNVYHGQHKFNFWFNHILCYISCPVFFLKKLLTYCFLLCVFFFFLSLTGKTQKQKNGGPFFFFRLSFV